MKILYLANLRLPTEKAHGIQIAKTCEALAEKGAEVLLVYPYRRNRIKENFFAYYGISKNFEFKKLWWCTPDINIYNYSTWKILDLLIAWPTFGLTNFIALLALSLYAVFNKADIIYSRDKWILWFLSLIGRKNLYFEAHRFPSAQKRLQKRLHISMKKRGIKIVTISRGLKDDFLNIGFADHDVLVAPDGVDLNEFKEELTKQEARKRVGLPENKKIVMYTGHLLEWKGIGVLLEVARSYQLQATNYKPLFVFVGGTNRDVKTFREKAEETKLNNVMILDHRPHKDIPVFLRAADILVLPNSAKEAISRSYTSPLKLFEYMASGRPVVASNLSSVREILNNQNSLLIPPDEPSRLFEGIQKIIGNQELSSRLANRALEDVRQYTWQKRAEKIINFLSTY